MKAREVRELSDEELAQKIRGMKRDIARMHTIATQREKKQ